MNGWQHDEALALAASILARRDDFIRVLTKVATKRAARDELERTIQALAGLPWELEQHRPRRVESIAVFLPSNNLLYSFTLFGLIPSFYSDQVVVRPSSRVRETIEELFELLQSVPSATASNRGRIEITTASQRVFVNAVSQCDAVIFTGQFENGVEIMSRLSTKTLFLLFGSGPNPLVLGPNFSVNDAVRTSIAARTYNSGQDCLCADLIIVHESMLEGYLKALQQELATVQITPREEESALVAPLIYSDAVVSARRFILEHEKAVAFGGQVDVELMTVQPSIVVQENLSNLHPPELFSPIFCVTKFAHEGEIREWANSSEELKRGMFLSTFGQHDLLEQTLGTSMVLANQLPFDHENGNRPFGGHGVQGGAMRAKHGRLIGRPLLLSAELARWQET